MTDDMTDDLTARLRAGPDDVPADVTERTGAAADAGGLVDVAWTTTETPVGRLLLAATAAGLVRISYTVDDEVLAELAERVSPRVLEVPVRLDGVRRQLDEYFAGRRRHFDIPVDPSLADGFRRRVLAALRQVGYGETVSYGELARRVDNPGATRAVGTAMRTNPIPIVQPCHRVLPAGGALGNYAGGVERKRALLQLEGALLV